MCRSNKKVIRHAGKYNPQLGIKIANWNWSSNDSDDRTNSQGHTHSYYNCIPYVQEAIVRLTMLHREIEDIKRLKLNI